MEHLVSEILNGATGAGAYGLVLLVLLLCGLGVPLPEDIALITGGYLVFNGTASLYPMLAITYAGILGGDAIAYGLGHHFGRRIEKIWPFRLYVTPSKRHKVERLFARYGDKIVVAARFMPGVRAVTYFFAGNARMKFRRFLLFDGLAALISAPLFVLLGRHFGENIETLIGQVRRGQTAVIVVMVLLLAAWVGYRIFRRRRTAAEAAAEVEADAGATPEGPARPGMHAASAQAPERPSPSVTDGRRAQDFAGR